MDEIRFDGKGRLSEISRTISMNQETWNRLGELAAAYGVSRSEALRRLINEAADSKREAIDAIRDVRLRLNAEQPESYRCATCGKWFKWQRVHTSCGVLHGYGECCHEYETEVASGNVLEPEKPQRENLT